MIIVIYMYDVYYDLDVMVITMCNNIYHRARIKCFEG